mgnify:CR=1 FL=1
MVELSAVMALRCMLDAYGHGKDHDGDVSNSGTAEHRK